MQVPKDEVRNRIVDAATEEFLVAGYQQASMRRIAALAKVATANIYAYFNNKEELFKSIVEPTVLSMSRLISTITLGSRQARGTLQELSQAIVQAFLDNRIPSLILLNSSEGSRYQNVRADLTTLASHRLTVELFPLLPEEQRDPLFADMLAKAVIEGTLELCTHGTSDPARMDTLLSAFLALLFPAISQES